MVDFRILWFCHPQFMDLCNHINQCAIRMGTTFHRAEIDMSSYEGVRCWEANHKGKNHTLRAQELADWISKQHNLFGTKTVTKNAKSSDFKNRQGLVFFIDGWGATDHIDLWNGTEMAAGYPNYFSKAKEVWFWDLP